jgi:glycosyltransferase involved in cell wall biosynthesis
MNRVLVTIPVFNEGSRIVGTVEELIKELESHSFDFRVAIVEDGSTDSTKKRLGELASSHPSLVIRTDAIKRGRGFALKRFWSESDADIFLFLDADLSTGTHAVCRVIDEVGRGTDVVAASRYCEGASVNRPPIRTLVSKAYNWLIRRTFTDGIYDHQCGLKGFSAKATRALLQLSRESSWFWDTEVLVLARALGFTVKEVPVEWRETKYRRTPLARLLSDFYLHGSGYLRLAGTLKDRLAKSSVSALGTPLGSPSVPSLRGGQIESPIAK